jgi:hypothetical protein
MVWQTAILEKLYIYIETGRLFYCNSRVSIPGIARITNIDREQILWLKPRRNIQITKRSLISRNRPKKKDSAVQDIFLYGKIWHDWVEIRLGNKWESTTVCQHFALDKHGRFLKFKKKNYEYYRSVSFFLFQFRNDTINLRARSWSFFSKALLLWTWLPLSDQGKKECSWRDGEWLSREGTSKGRFTGRNYDGVSDVQLRRVQADSLLVVVRFLHHMHVCRPVGPRQHLRTNPKVAFTEVASQNVVRVKVFAMERGHTCWRAWNEEKNK